MLFESGAIVLHIAGRHPGLLPVDPNARARAVTWMFAAVSSLEPVIIDRETTWFMERDKPWFAERMPMVEDRIRRRLGDLEARLGGAEWLDGAFSAGDLLMAQVLRRLCGTELLQEHPWLNAYVARAESRPAFQRAFAVQRAVFADRSGNRPGAGA